MQSVKLSFNTSIFAISLIIIVDCVNDPFLRAWGWGYSWLHVFLSGVLLIIWLSSHSCLSLQTCTASRDSIFCQVAEPTYYPLATTPHDYCYALFSACSGLPHNAQHSYISFFNDDNSNCNNPVWMSIIPAWKFWTSCDCVITVISFHQENYTTQSFCMDHSISLVFHSNINITLNNWPTRLTA